MKKVTPSLIFTAFAAVVMVFATYAARGFPKLARIYPWFVGVVGVVLTLLLIITDLRETGKEKGTENAKQSGITTDLESDSHMPKSVMTRKTIRAFLWIVALYLAIWMFGFKIGVVVFLIAYISIEEQPRWYLTVGLSVGLTFLLFCFDRFLHVYWVEGLLSRWLGESLPWLF